ncbi:zinc finger protein 182 isoform X2 [Amyelois transitella]|uniref:zinc finger protein 182 isoform X2 n=1 Tax=Amyelois transitella TaxID=680683 RepID=UPI00067E57D4|nr:zinc finger protein 182 isoform X2 [Amyelois transitella]
MEDCEGQENDSSQYSLKRCVTKNKLANIITTEDGTVHYCCIECPVRYLDKAELELHLCMHTKEYRYLCGICGKGLKRKEHLDRHTMEHDETRPFVCTDCGKGFKRKEHLNIHMAVHRGDKTHSCGICGRTFSRKDHVQKHLQTHSKELLVGLEPDSPGSEDTGVKNEAMDYDSTFEDSADVINYEQSQDVDPMDITSHLSVSPHKSGEEIRYPCYYCEKTYKIKSHLQAHLQTHVDNEEMHEALAQLAPDNPGNSQWLPFNGAGYPQLSTGLLIPRPPPKPPKDPRPHNCDICDKKFKRKQHLKVHMNVHLRMQPTIWCSLCNKGFYSNTQFENHKCSVKAGGENGNETVEVNERNENKIPAGGVKIINTIVPVTKREEESNIPVPGKVYVCKYCSKPFRRKDHYKIHLHIHTGFYRKDHLQKHTQTHKKEITPPPPTTKKRIPDLFPICMAPRSLVKAGLNAVFKPHALKKTTPSEAVKPEITILAPSNSKLRVPLRIKVPYEMVVSNENGEETAITVDPQDGAID